MKQAERDVHWASRSASQLRISSRWASSAGRGRGFERVSKSRGQFTLQCRAVQRERHLSSAVDIGSLRGEQQSGDPHRVGYRNPKSMIELPNHGKPHQGKVRYAPRETPSILEDDFVDDML